MARYNTGLKNPAPQAPTPQPTTPQVNLPYIPPPAPISSTPTGQIVPNRGTAAPAPGRYGGTQPVGGGDAFNPAPTQQVPPGYTGRGGTAPPTASIPALPPTPAPANPVVNPTNQISQLDPTYDRQIAAIERRLAETRQGLDLEDIQDKESYDRNVRTFGQQRDQQLESVLDRMAGQGILRSGITANEQSEVSQNFANIFEQLQAGRLAGQTGRARQLSIAGSNAEDARIDALQGRTSRQTETELRRAQEAAETQAILRQLEQVRLLNSQVGGTGTSRGGTRGLDAPILKPRYL